MKYTNPDAPSPEAIKRFFEALAGQPDEFPSQRATRHQILGDIAKKGGIPALLKSLPVKSLLILLLFLSSCTPIQANPKRARITFYGYPGEPTAEGGKCVEGVTVAAHPKRPFGTNVRIPGLAKHFGDEHFEVEDRGSAVTSMKASKGKVEVLDVYVRNAKKRYKMATQLDEYMTVIYE